MIEDVLTRHPHARAVLLGALAPGRQPSHAYLFHGPAGSGKRAAATEFAAALLRQGSADPENAAQRVRNGAHPDYTYVAPSGAAQLIKEDIETAVITAATRTPFEAEYRVFVLERADSMNDTAYNRLLKTLEEPASFVCLILLTDHPAAMPDTIVSRCQPVRFEAASAAELTDRLQNSYGIPSATAAACAQLSLGDGERALRLALGEGESLRSAAQQYTRAVISGSLADARSALLLDQASEHERRAKDEVEARFLAEAEVLGDRERKRHQREGETAAKRAGRRAKAQTLDDGLRLVSLWLRDVAVAADGEPALIRNGDRADLIAEDAQLLATGRPFAGEAPANVPGASISGRPFAGEAPANVPGASISARARDAVALVEESRTTLILNPSEPLLLDALASRMERVLNG